MDKSTEVLSSADIELRKTSSIAIFEESRANTREAHPNQDVVFSLNGDGGTLALLMDGVSTGAITPESLRKAVNQGSLVLRDITSGEIVKRLTSPNIDGDPAEELTDERLNESIEGALGRALNLMHKSIASDNPEFASTAILAVIHPGKDSDYLTYASIGDSHLYVFSDDNLQQLNSDDVDYSKKGEPLTRYLGGDKIGAQVDENNVNSIAIPEKARCIMLASDGVYKYIHPDTLTDLMPLALKSDNPAKFILDKIKQIRGEELGEPDNRIYPDDASIVILKLDTHDNSALSYALRDVINESEGNRHGVLESIAIPSRDAEEKQRLIKEQITQINNLTDDMVYHTLQQRDFQGMLMEPGQYEGGAIQPEQVVGTALLEATKRIRFMELPEEGMSVDQALRFSLVGYLTKMADRSVHTKPLEEAIQNFTREKSEYEERMKASQSLIDQRHIERLIRDTATDIELVREQIERVRTNPRLESNTLQEKLYRYIHQTIQTTVGDTLALRTLPFEQAQLYLHLAAMLKIPLDKNVINTLPFESPNLDTINVFSYADSKQEWEKLQG